jgi:spore germination cell wall hydrolase CwlJ-like protein
MDGRRLAPLVPLALMALALLPAPARAPAPPAGASPPPLPKPVAAVQARPARKASETELRCLALNVYWESRGQPLAGQLAVAYVTLNRVGAPGFPASICGVVHQGCQFGWTCEGGSKTPTDSGAWEQALAVARQSLAGVPDPTDGAQYFHHVQERPQWARGRYGHRVVIGQHVFFSVGGNNDQQVAESR